MQVWRVRLPAIRKSEKDDRKRPFGPRHCWSTQFLPLVLLIEVLHPERCGKVPGVRVLVDSGHPAVMATQVWAVEDRRWGAMI